MPMRAPTIKFNLTSLLFSSILTTPSFADELVAINFIRNSTTTPAANDGSEYGIDTWQDVLVDESPATVDGLDITWDSTGGWNGGGNNIINGYMDNANWISVAGLEDWLAANNAPSYTVQTIGASDTDSNWFGNTLLRDTDATGPLLDTLTNPNLRNGLSTVSIDLSVDVLYIDPTLEGTAPVDGGAPRTSVAAVIITANSVELPPEVKILTTEFVAGAGDGATSEIRITVASDESLNYQLLRSPDLLSAFQPVGQKTGGTGLPLELIYSFASDTEPSGFFRVQLTAQ